MRVSAREFLCCRVSLCVWCCALSVRERRVLLTTPSFACAHRTLYDDDISLSKRRLLLLGLLCLCRRRRRRARRLGALVAGGSRRLGLGRAVRAVGRRLEHGVFGHDELQRLGRCARLAARGVHRTLLGAALADRRRRRLARRNRPQLDVGVRDVTRATVGTKKEVNRNEIELKPSMN